MSNSLPVTIPVPASGLGAAVSVSDLAAGGRTLVFAGASNGDQVELWGGPSALLLGPVARRDGGVLRLSGPNDHEYFEDGSLFYAYRRISGSGVCSSSVVGTSGGSSLGSGFAFNVSNVGAAFSQNLSAFILAGNDGITNSEGDVVFLYAQTDPTQNGPWVVGVETVGVAPLTRPGWWGSGQRIAPGASFYMTLGDVFAGIRWTSFSNYGFIVDSSNPAVFPEKVSFLTSLVAGTVTVTDFPIRSLQFTSISAQRLTPVGTALTVQYNPVNRVSGPFGTATFDMQAQLANGAINVADGSTLIVTVDNQ